MSELRYDARGLAPTCPVRCGGAALRRRTWSPYAAGVLIGLLQVPAFLLVNTALGASSSFVTLGAHVAAWFDPGAIDNAYFAAHAAGGKNWWQVALVAGIALGAFLSARLSGTRRGAVAPAWRKATGIATFAPRAAMAFAGGFILLFGARIAGGCTSGHGISGLAQLAVSSGVTVAAMFAAGIGAALLMRRV
ncbi:YeeE/YedE family protein [uncultured Alphaproteobacteria bacterium]|uniref:YeeE/YedE family protein n=1 Tax=uncultured Alphaproteobacteria bacterium TaxID=91750 RepID=A0A212KHB5_9PROT|nr:YeeE/YedE family protein [uncultured Alphaproteobacteria bacterium]